MLPSSGPLFGSYANIGRVGGMGKDCMEVFICPKVVMAAIAIVSIALFLITYMEINFGRRERPSVPILGSNPTRGILSEVTHQLIL